MEKYKKWEDHHSPGEYAYQTWKEGWIGALKWVLKMIVRGDSLGSIVAQIKKELGLK